VSKNANGRPMFEIIEYPRIQYGDVNQDGEVDSLDVTYLKRYILKSKDFELPEYGLLAADVDGDGIVDSLDLTYLKRYVLRKVTELPANRK
jgi:arabinan endo-1,5-alpha-L-arabinosidase